MGNGNSVTESENREAQMGEIGFIFVFQFSNPLIESLGNDGGDKKSMKHK